MHHPKRTKNFKSKKNTQAQLCKQLTHLKATSKGKFEYANRLKLQLLFGLWPSIADSLARKMTLIYASLKAAFLKQISIDTRWLLIDVL